MTPFATHLARHGPDASPRSWSLDAARSYCARLTRSHYENFAVASVLLPRRLLPHFYPVYAYCRWADDLADETGGGHQSLGLLAWWRTELLEMYAGRPTHPVMVALRPTVEYYLIPPTPFLDLLVAFEQDQHVNRYATYDDLLYYCRHSANPVGRLVLYLARSFDEDRAAYSDDICTALQLTNFWQDARRDLDDLNRVYLPAEDRRRFDYPDADLLARRFTPAFAELMKFQVNRTRELFDRGRPLLSMVPSDVRPDIELFLRGGRAVLDRIEAIGFDVWSQRPTVGKAAKAGLVLRAAGGRLWDWITGRSTSRRPTGTASS
jgi:squalene synthase HpnC